MKRIFTKKTIIYNDIKEKNNSIDLLASFDKCNKNLYDKNTDKICSPNRIKNDKHTLNWASMKDSDTWSNHNRTMENIIYYQPLEFLSYTQLFGSLKGQYLGNLTYNTKSNIVSVPLSNAQTLNSNDQHPTDKINPEANLKEYLKDKKRSSSSNRDITHIMQSDNVIDISPEEKSFFSLFIDKHSSVENYSTNRNEKIENDADTNIVLNKEDNPKNNNPDMNIIPPQHNQCATNDLNNLQDLQEIEPTVLDSMSSYMNNIDTILKQMYDHAIFQLSRSQSIHHLLVPAINYPIMLRINSKISARWLRYFLDCFGIVCKVRIKPYTSEVNSSNNANKYLQINSNTILENIQIFVEYLVSSQTWFALECFQYIYDSKFENKEGFDLTDNTPFIDLYHINPTTSEQILNNINSSDLNINNVEDKYAFCSPQKSISSISNNAMDTEPTSLNNQNHTSEDFTTLSHNIPSVYSLPINIISAQIGKTSIESYHTDDAIVNIAFNEYASLPPNYIKNLGVPLSVKINNPKVVQFCLFGLFQQERNSIKTYTNNYFSNYINILNYKNYSRMVDYNNIVIPQSLTNITDSININGVNTKDTCVISKALNLDYGYTIPVPVPNLSTFIQNKPIMNFNASYLLSQEDINQTITSLDYMFYLFNKEIKVILSSLSDINDTRLLSILLIFSHKQNDSLEKLKTCKGNSKNITDIILLLFNLSVVINLYLFNISLTLLIKDKEVSEKYSSIILMQSQAFIHLKQLLSHSKKYILYEDLSNEQVALPHYLQFKIYYKGLLFDMLTRYITILLLINTQLPNIDYLYNELNSLVMIYIENEEINVSSLWISWYSEYTNQDEKNKSMLSIILPAHNNTPLLPFLLLQGRISIPLAFF